MNKLLKHAGWLLKTLFCVCFTFVGLTNIVLGQSCTNDTIPPIINLNTSDTVYHEVNTSYVAVTATVTDNCSDLPRISLTRKSNINPFVVGCYVDEYTAIDEAGNETTKNRWVCVQNSNMGSIKQSAQISKWRIYPNPSFGTFKVLMNAGQLEAGASLTVFDVFGKSIITFSNISEVTEVDLKSHTSGVYLIQLATSNTVYVERVVVQ